MSASLKDRVELLERQVEELVNAIRTEGPTKSWRATFGASASDQGFEEMVRLGQEIRHRRRPPGRASARS
jgi:hypothetical protein